MKNQALFSSKDKSKIHVLKCGLLQFLFGAISVNFDQVFYLEKAYSVTMTNIQMRRFITSRFIWIFTVRRRI